LAEKADFKVIEMISYGGLAMSFASELGYCLDNLLGIKIMKPLAITLFDVILFGGWLLSFIDPTKKYFPLGYVFTIQKQ
jgi:hypothetical protein